MKQFNILLIGIVIGLCTMIVINLVMPMTFLVTNSALYMDKIGGIYFPHPKFYCVSMSNKTGFTPDYIEEHELCHAFVHKHEEHFC